MNILLALIPAFAFLAFFYFSKSRTVEKKLQQQHKELNRKLYEITVLNSFSGKIGYSLNVEDIAQTIVVTIEQLLHLSTISYGLIKEDAFVINTIARERVNDLFVNQVNAIMLSAIHAIDEDTKKLRVVGMVSKGEGIEKSGRLGEDGSNNVQSYFNIPLVINNKLVGMITIASGEKKVYQEEDMSVVYKLINQAERASERLEAVVEREKQKLSSLILSLPTGAILFLFEQGTLQLATINASARTFLRLTDDSTTSVVIASFGLGRVLIDKIKETIQNRATSVIQEAKIFDKHFKVFVNPVFSEHTLIGISITMEDQTDEREMQILHDSFMNMIVHEMRAPLTSIKEAAQLLTSEKLTEEEKKNMTTIIQHSSQRLLSDIGDVLDAAKLEAGQFKIEKSSSDLNELITERVALFNIQAEEKHTVIHTDLDITLPNFEFDRARIGQVINNLLSNSIKHTSSGAITVKSAKKGAFATVSVTDSGIGIPQSQRMLLFSKFGQIQGARRAPGTGLGLYISKGIIESHGGRISLDSQEGHGTIVYFALPLSGVVVEEKPDQNLETRAVN